MKSKLNILNLIIRYAFILIFSLGNLYLLYLIFEPLTIYPVYFILNLLYKDVVLFGNLIDINGSVIELIRPCIAVSAYYLLIVLNLATPMPLKKRINTLIFLLSTLLIINIFRIILLSVFFINKFQFFDITHKLFWYSLSIIFVIAIWFFSVKLFNINEIPGYSDIINIKKAVK